MVNRLPSNPGRTTNLPSRALRCLCSLSTLTACLTALFVVTWNIQEIVSCVHMAIFTSLVSGLVLVVLCERVCGVVFVTVDLVSECGLLVFCVFLCVVCVCVCVCKAVDVPVVCVCGVVRGTDEDITVDAG